MYDHVYVFIQIIYDLNLVVVCLFICLFSYSPDVNVTWPNPLVNMNVTWTEEMVSDLRRRFDEAKTFVPLCSRVRTLSILHTT